jgi:precorrin-2 dehydrogenase/sirohydrochlorin ferrochelatase
MAEMDYFPVFIDLKGRLCLVVGDGDLADEKARALEKAGGCVRQSSRFVPDEAEDAFLIVAAVEDPVLAREIKDFAEANRILVNVVDQTEHCNFIAPALVQRGDLLIAISTSGRSPALAKKIRRELESKFGPEYGELLRALGEIRPRVKAQFSSFDDRRDFYSYLVEDLDLLETTRCRGFAEVRARIERALEER